MYGNLKSGLKTRKDQGLSLIADNVVEDMTTLLDSLEGQISSFITETQALGVGQLRQLNRENKTKLYSAFESKFSLNLGNIIDEEKLAPVLQAATAQNLDLIKSLGADPLSKVKSMVFQQIADGEFSQKTLRDFMVKRLGIDKRRATFIARDQTHKFNAVLTEARVRQTGAGTYIWRNANDMRVRGRPGGLYPNSKYNHWNREGKVYSYDKPPADGNPGEPVNCRCYAEIVIKGFND
jgi:SPP1 gp7 family putative phage head morphogenesis protein